MLLVMLVTWMSHCFLVPTPEVSERGKGDCTFLNLPSSTRFGLVCQPGVAAFLSLLVTCSSE
jgi:hypothetical protein